VDRNRVLRMRIQRYSQPWRKNRGLMCDKERNGHEQRTRSRSRRFCGAECNED
jgi:hypothetical protein